MTNLRMKIDISNFFNNLISDVNELLELQNSLEDEEFEGYTDYEVLYENLKDKVLNLSGNYTIDIAFQIVIGYLKSISERAIELNDEKLIELLEGLGCLSSEKGES